MDAVALAESLRWIGFAFLGIAALKWLFLVHTRRTLLQLIKMAVIAAGMISGSFLSGDRPDLLIAVGSGSLALLLFIDWLGSRWPEEPADVSTVNDQEECCCPDCDCHREAVLPRETPMGEQKICTECAAGRHVAATISASSEGPMSAPARSPWTSPG